MKAKDIWLKAKKEIPILLLSFLFAVGLWYFNQLQHTEVRSFQLEPQLQISEKMLPIRAPKAITVTVRGPGEQLQSIDPKDFLLSVDLKGMLTEGEYNGKIEITRMGVARHLKGIEVSFSPVSVPVTLERKITKAVPVQVVTQGNVKTGYELEIGVPTPDTVMVTGPRTLMEKLSFIQTEPVNLEKLTESLPENEQSALLDQSVLLVSPFDSSASVLFNRETEIMYTCQIREIIKQKDFGPLYVNQIGTDEKFRYQLSEEQVRLTLSGPELKLNRLNSDRLIVGVELDFITEPGSYQVPVVRMFDSKTEEELQGITDLGINPPALQVVVEEP